MSVDISQVEAIRNQALLQIQDLMATAGPTISVNGVDVVWAPLLTPLQRTIDWCDGKIAITSPTKSARAARLEEGGGVSSRQ